MDGFAVFGTPVGDCGIAWTNDTIVSVQLPDADGLATRTRMTRKHPLLTESEPPAVIAEVIARIRALFAGGRDDLGDVELDMRALTPFEQRVYATVRKIRPGSTLTYGEVAVRIGSPNAAREVGAALGRNPFPIIVPCHRVVAANGKTGGFSAPGGVKTKLRLLALEDTGGPLFEQG
jgi:methylated-DNA-[protein]-cysteine S-methyltransferase